MWQPPASLVEGLGSLGATWHKPQPQPLEILGPLGRHLPRAQRRQTLHLLHVRLAARSTDHALLVDVVHDVVAAMDVQLPEVGRRRDLPRFRPVWANHRGLARASKPCLHLFALPAVFLLRVSLCRARGNSAVSAASNWPIAAIVCGSACPVPTAAFN